jgi:AcrR family transcriptional regulator
LERLADHVLATGLASASLRPLAAASGTSDRMLLYYFRDKNDLLAATLGCIAARMLALLNDALPGQYRYAALLPKVAALLASDALRPYMVIWLELAALAARGQEPFQTIAGQLADGFLAWTGERLEVGEPQRAPQAALLLATVDGMMLLRAIGRQGAVSAALQAAKAVPRSGGKQIRQ